MQKVWRAFTSFILMLTLILCAFEVYRCTLYVIDSVKTGTYQGYLWLAIGMAAFLIFTALFFKKNRHLVYTLTHEGAHFLVGALFLRRKITEFNAKAIEYIKSGENLGEVWSVGSNNVFMSLAPYMLPYFTFIFVFMRLMIKPDCLPIIDFIIGFTLMFHFACWNSYMGSYQGDLKVCGLFRSYLFIWTFIFFNVAIILYSLGGGMTAPVDIIQANVTWFTQAWNDILWVVSLITN